MTPRRQIEMPDSWEDPLAHDDGPAEKVKFDSRLALDFGFVGMDYQEPWARE
jgi:hypothetical protein